MGTGDSQAESAIPLREHIGVQSPKSAMPTSPLCLLPAGLSTGKRDHATEGRIYLGLGQGAGSSLKATPSARSAVGVGPVSKSGLMAYPTPHFIFYSASEVDLTSNDSHRHAHVST